MSALYRCIGQCLTTSNRFKSNMSTSSSFQLNKIWNATLCRLLPGGCSTTASKTWIVSGYAAVSSALKSIGTKVCAWGFDNLTPKLPVPFCYRLMEPAPWVTAQETCHGMFSDVLGVGSGYQGLRAISLPSLLCHMFDLSLSKLTILSTRWNIKWTDTIMAEK